MQKSDFWVQPGTLLKVKDNRSRDRKRVYLVLAIVDLAAARAVIEALVGGDMVEFNVNRDPSRSDYEKVEL